LNWNSEVVHIFVMVVGCGLIDYDDFLLNVENPQDYFLEHISKCDKCRKEFVEMRLAILKMGNTDLSSIPTKLKFGRVLVRMKENILEIIDAISGTRYGANLAFRGEGIVSSRREVVYESKDIKIFIDLYDDRELVMSVRVYDYGDIYIYKSGNLVRSSSGKSGVDLRVDEGVYKVKYNDYDIFLEFKRGD